MEMRTARLGRTLAARRSSPIREEVDLAIDCYRDGSSLVLLTPEAAWDELIREIGGEAGDAEVRYRGVTLRRSKTPGIVALAGF
jgi:hypothetical protein